MDNVDKINCLRGKPKKVLFTMTITNQNSHIEHILYVV